jgi:methylated-DNA-[protein]-cysteine S-methyltransferase
MILFDRIAIVFNENMNMFIRGDLKPMSKIYTTYYNSKIGTIEIKGTEEGIISVLYLDSMPEMESKGEEIPVCLKECVLQLNEYFEGKRKEFTVDLIIQGTEFQNKVWNSLREIIYGHTVSYADIAEKVGNSKAVRAVGTTNGKNKINIIIPCHRVIGKDGSLTGYGGGLWRKEWLLEHESR